MEQGHENQAWLHSPESWFNGNSIQHQIPEWPGGTDRMLLLLSRIDESDLESMKTDPPHDPSGKRAPMTAVETINSMCLQPVDGLNNQHERD
eukprot:617736-Heterocapsa_arctica.AAC.1